MLHGVLQSYGRKPVVRGLRLQKIFNSGSELLNREWLGNKVVTTGLGTLLLDTNTDPRCNG